MGGRSSSKQGLMEVDLNNSTNNNKLKEEPHLSGAYIRSLVKQLTSSRSKDLTNPKDPSVCVDDDALSAPKLAKFGEAASENKPAQQPHKKQVRRRLHTSRPYQERLLNMAEARKEIVAALKFHRASMKQANEQQQQQQQPLRVVQHEEIKVPSRRTSRTNHSSTANFPSNFDGLSCTSLAPPPPPPPYPFCWSTPPAFTSTFPENLNFPLPNQTLGLNLNFQDFNDLDTSLYHSSNNPSSVYSSSSPSSFSSPSPSFSIATEDIPSLPKSQEAMFCDITDQSHVTGGLHQVMDDDEIAEIRSIGEQHEMEWNDTMNLVTSAWWFKFLKTMESGPEVKAEDDGYQPFDQVMEFPSWLNATDGCLQQHFDDYCSQDYYQDPSLPCMDIGEIEGIDGEWLA